MAYIGLGSNVGDRRANIEGALRRLADVPGVRILRSSAVLETEPVGKTDQPRFLNAAVEIECALEPEEMLGHLQRIESEMGRIRTERWGPRSIDLDLLLFRRRRVRTEQLTVPHPRLAERRFVLEPLVGLCPDLVVPGTGRTVRQLWKDIAGTEDYR